jgi:hypothetical protein
VPATPSLDENARIAQMAHAPGWRRWGPYLAERQWGTVREDYSADGDAWTYLPHDDARSRAYRWGEDGIAGFSDDRQHICLSLALWNGVDPILKERLYGLTNGEGNHGEDVKELYWYLDGVPSHAYMKMLYKYPQRAFPYTDLKEQNARRGLDQPEYEILDTGVFADGRYFDVVVEYAKASEDDVLMLVRVTNRGPDAASLHVLPHVWFRNTWSWNEGSERPRMTVTAPGALGLQHPVYGDCAWQCQGPDGAPELLLCENETNTGRLFNHPAAGLFKDGINDAVVHGRSEAVSAAGSGTKAAAHVDMTLASGEAAQVRVRLRRPAASDAFADFDETVAARRAEADAFYASLQRSVASPDAALVQRQALAGMLWSKQFYGYDVWRWLQGDPAQPAPPPERLEGRNHTWPHLVLGDVETVGFAGAGGAGGDILAMPDCWEYPWFAAWDLAFHAVTLALIDPAFAKAQLLLLTRERTLNPNGQMAAYEWSFSDVNPPIHAWAALRVFEMDRASTGTADFAFLKSLFGKLLLNFTWWVNREDAEGNNIFQGGFLGLDNIGLFDLSKPLPGGGVLEQSDGTAWAAIYALSMMRIAIVLASEDASYEDFASKFFAHFVFIAAALHGDGVRGIDGLWDEEDQFYYDVLKVEGEPPQRLRIRSLVGLLPILASEVLTQDFEQDLPAFAEWMRWFVRHRPEFAELVSDWEKPGPNGHRLLAMLRKHRLNAVLLRMLDENEFLSPHGIRSVSRYHLAHPYRFARQGEVFELRYEPGEGETRIYGGNSNWRGPVWMPINYLLIEALRTLHRFYGDEFTMALPSGSSTSRTLGQVADELSARLQGLFLADAQGTRAFLGKDPPSAGDRGFDGLIQFHEYFDGDDGRGLGASHQTGWTGLVALLIANSNPEP